MARRVSPYVVFPDSSFAIFDNEDPTKKLQFQLSGLPPNTTVPFSPHILYNVRARGAKGDGVADDSAAIQDTVAEMEAQAVSTGSGILYFPPGIYNAKNITLTKPVLVMGAGFQATTVRIPTGATATDDLFYFRPPVGVFRAFGVVDMTIGSQTAAEGRDSIRVDLVGGGRAAAQFWVHRCHILRSGGYGIKLNAGTSGAPSNTPTLFTSSIRDNLIAAGIDLTAAADSIAISDNTIFGEKGVIIDLIGGASGLLFSGNNVTAHGMLLVDRAHKPVIINNYFELLSGQVIASPDAAHIDLRGLSGTISQPVILHNTVAAQLVAGNHGIYLGAVTHAHIDYNNLNSAGAGFDIDIGASAANTIIGPNNSHAAGSGVTVNNGSATTRSQAWSFPGIPFVINEGGVDSDTRIEGDTDTNLFVVDANEDKVSVGVASPLLGAKFQIGNTPSAMAVLRLRANADGNASIQFTPADASTAWGNILVNSTALVFSQGFSEILRLVSSGMTIAEGKNVNLGPTTGTKIGTAITQKLGFFNATPVVQPTALTAANASTVDGTYGAEESAVINNLRIRLNELESRLKSLGLLA